MTAGDAPRGVGTALGRVRLAHRVMSVLDGLKPAEQFTIEPDAEGELGSAPEHLIPAFLLSALDLRLRVCLILDEEPSTYPSNEELNEAQEFIARWPETDALVLVSSDDAMTSWILEPYDRSGAYNVPSGSVQSGVHPRYGPDPLQTLLVAYLRTLTPQWNAISGPKREMGTDRRQLAASIAQDELRLMRERRPQIEAKKEAQRRLDERDASWIADLILTDSEGPEFSEHFAAEFRSHVKRSR